MWTKPVSNETALEAKRLFEKAQQLDPNWALAWTGMAVIYLTAATSRYGITKTPAEAQKLLLEAGQRAVALDPKSSDAFHRLSPGFRFYRQFDKALPAMEIAARLIPRTPRKATRNFHLGRTHLGMGNYEAAVAVAKEGITLNPKFPLQYWVLASALGWLGRKEEAQSVWLILCASTSSARHHRQIGQALFLYAEIGSRPGRLASRWRTGEIALRYYNITSVSSRKITIIPVDVPILIGILRAFRRQFTNKKRCEQWFP